MAACRVVANIEPAALNVRGESGEGAIPHHDAFSADVRHRSFYALGLFAARAFVDQDGPRQSPQHFFFERIGNALGWIFADAETDRCREFPRIQTRGEIWPRIRNSEGFR